MTCMIATRLGHVLMLSNNRVTIGWMQRLNACGQQPIDAMLIVDAFRGANDVIEDRRASRRITYI